MNLNKFLRSVSNDVDRFLRKRLPSTATRPQTLHRAMRYSLFAGGKRLRPALCIAAAESCGGQLTHALPIAAAIECVHTYSLIHDDLPCMDDDHLRRGRPTAHVQFGEAIAILAGDALLTLAFEILSEAPPTPRYPAASYVRELAIAAGSLHLVGGQVADLEAEGTRPSKRDVQFIHNGKTAAMIAASLRLGAMSADAPPDQVTLLSQFGQKLGRAFQIIDDILDLTQPSSHLGKSAGKDSRDEKATYPSAIGLDASRKEAAKLTRAAIRCLDQLGPSATRLKELANHLLHRTH